MYREGQTEFLSSNQKKRKTAKLTDLFAKLKTLEATHKCTLAQSIHMKFIEIRTRIQEQLGHNLKKKFNLSQKLFYEYGNKSGHLLAQSLRTKKARNTIHHLHSQKGQTITKNADIAHEFEQFLSKFSVQILQRENSSLYNINANIPNTPPTQKRQSEIHSFLPNSPAGKSQCTPPKHLILQSAQQNGSRQ